MIKTNDLRLLLSIVIVCIVIPTTALTGEVKVSWGPSEGASGYRVHRGTSSGQYSSFTDEGNTTSATADGLEDCRMWYFAVTAYNAAGESGFSPEVFSWPRAVLGAASPATAERGTQANVVVSGVNFRDGDVVALSNPGVQIDAVTMNSCSEMTLAVTVADNAPLGSSDITVTHPSGVAGSGVGLFAVMAPTIPSVVSATPADGATDVPVSVQPTVQFSEAVTGVTQTNVRLLDDQGTPVAQAAGSPVLSPDGIVATVVPAGPLAYGATYRIQVLGGASGVQDTDGNPMSGDFLQATGFTTETDDTAPVITGLTVTEITGTSAVVSWVTDEPADSRVFYRKQDHVLYQIEEDADLVTQHAVSLTGLEPTTKYEFHVSSTNASDVTATSSPDENFTTANSPHAYLRFEAESGVLDAPVSSDTGSGAFAAAWIDTPSGGQQGTPGSPLGTATYGVFVPEAGTWYLWARLAGDGTGSDSWFEAIDGAAPEPISPSVHDEWTWAEGRSYSLTAGLHVVELAGFDPGARADRLLLTDDPDFQPTEQPDVDDTPPGPVTGLVAPGGPGQILLSWSNPTSGDLARVVVRYRTDGQFPNSPVDGLPLVDQSAEPGGAGSYTHSGLEQGVAFYYGVFAIDESDNVSNAAHVVGTAMGVPPSPVGLIVH